MYEQAEGASASEREIQPVVIESDQTANISMPGRIIAFAKKYLLPDFHHEFDPSKRKSLAKIGATAVAAAATLVLGKVGYDNLIEPWQQYDQESANDRIEKVGLGDFIPFYQAASDLQAAYRGTPALSSSPDITVYDDGSDPFNILSRVATEGYIRDGDDIYNRGIHNLRDNWGEKREAAQGLAASKVQLMEVYLQDDPTLGDTEASARKAYSRFAEVVPAMVMMAPDRLEIVNAGGAYLAPGQGEHAYVQIMSPAYDPEGFYVAGIHELAHAEVQWQDGKAFTRRQDYAAYIALEAKGIKTVLDDYFSKDWKSAQTYLGGNGNNEPLVWYYDADSQLTYLPYHDDNPTNPSVESSFRDSYGMDLDSIAPLSREQKNDPRMVLNRVIWAAGHHQQEVLKRQAVIQKAGTGELSQEDQDYLSDPDISTLLGRAVGEVDHYFRGPVQRSGGGLPGESLPPDAPHELITRLNIQIQQARLRAFSTLTPAELRSFATSSQLLRNRFGLDGPQANAV